MTSDGTAGYTDEDAYKEPHSVYPHPESLHSPRGVMIPDVPPEQNDAAGAIDSAIPANEEQLADDYLTEMMTFGTPGSRNYKICIPLHRSDQKKSANFRHELC